MDHGYELEMELARCVLTYGLDAAGHPVLLETWTDADGGTDVPMMTRLGMIEMSRHTAYEAMSRSATPDDDDQEDDL
ncbi:hypothetical protein [Corynebacterium variabile]|uniref:hypothetical protein n=1 Tax=Corynebacterium variabile TaxID=1727 RepID=UPI003FD064E0